MLKPSWCYLKCLYKSKHFYSANEIVCFKQALDYIETIEHNSPEENKWYNLSYFCQQYMMSGWGLTALVFLAVQVVYSFTISYNYMDVIKMLVVAMIFSSTCPNDNET